MQIYDTTASPPQCSISVLESDVTDNYKLSSLRQHKFTIYSAGGQQS